MADHASGGERSADGGRSSGMSRGSAEGQGRGAEGASSKGHDIWNGPSRAAEQGPPVSRLGETMQVISQALHQNGAENGREGPNLKEAYDRVHDIWKGPDACVVPESVLMTEKGPGDLEPKHVSGAEHGNLTPTPGVPDLKPKSGWGPESRGKSIPLPGHEVERER